MEEDMQNKVEGYLKLLDGVREKTGDEIHMGKLCDFKPRKEAAP